MITLAILQQMATDNVAKLEVDKNFFWEEMPLQKDGNPAQGVWLVTRGAGTSTSTGLNQHTTVDFYVAFNSKPKTESVLEEIRNWVQANPTLCELRGAVGNIRYSFDNVRIRPATTPQNYGATSNGMIVKVASAEIYFDKSTNQEVK